MVYVQTKENISFFKSLLVNKVAKEEDHVVSLIYKVTGHLDISFWIQHHLDHQRPNTNIGKVFTLTDTLFQLVSPAVLVRAMLLVLKNTTLISSESFPAE